MTDITSIQIKRRHTGAAGAPTTLKSGELAFNEVDGNFYYGAGDNGSEQATSVVPVGGAAKADANAVTAALSQKANATDVANGLAAKADAASTANALATKADASALAAVATAKADAATVYTKAEVDQMTADLRGGLAPEQLNSITELANAALAGTAVEVALAASIATKASSADVTALAAAKADAAAVYTKTEVNSLISGATPTGVDGGLF
jgi:hypothetical protein